MRTPLVGLLLLLAKCAFAEPVDLADPTARWIEVAFEVSPRDMPARADTIYTPKIRAWLEAGDTPGTARVTVDRLDVERVLLVGHDPVEGSFSDFVWVFDAATGEVLSASFFGSVRKEIDWGLFRTHVRTRIEVDMATGRAAGFEQPHEWLGQQIFRYCNPGGGRSPSCTLVPASGYDPASGYVNAVGELLVHFGEMELHTFSPLGEAVFSEVEPESVLASPGPDPRRFEQSAFRADGHGR